MGLALVLLEILKKPSMVDVLSELMMLIVPLWIAVLVGVLVGWAWKPKWANLSCRDLNDSSVSEESNNRTLTDFKLIPSLNFSKFQLPTCISGSSDDRIHKDLLMSHLPPILTAGSSSKLQREQSSIVIEDDLEHLRRIVNEKDGGSCLDSDDGSFYVDYGLSSLAERSYGNFLRCCCLLHKLLLMSAAAAAGVAYIVVVLQRVAYIVVVLQLLLLQKKKLKLYLLK